MAAGPKVREKGRAGQKETETAATMAVFEVGFAVARRVEVEMEEFWGARLAASTGAPKVVAV